ncbi:MAG TPA: caspase family protein [Candidatus Binatia bacterium]|nr:caspase family protein [Candidatus Binatia bacterium]
MRHRSPDPEPHGPLARGRWTLRILSVALLAAAATMTAAEAPAQSGGGASGSPPAWAQTGDEYLMVDCLLPSQIRRLGSKMTFLAPRRAIKTSSRDCEIRGGEYVSYDRANYATALKVWLAPAEQGDATAQTYVGEIYEKGLGVAPDYAAAALWYRRAVDKGSSRAALNLGALYERGLGVPADPKEAAALYRRASGLPAIAFDPPSTVAPEEVRRLEAEVQRLRRDLDAKALELDRTRQETAAVRGQLDQRQAEAQAARAEIDRLKRERSQLDPKDSAANARLSTLQREIEDGESRLEATEREIGALQGRLARIPAGGGRVDPAGAAELNQLKEDLAQAELRASLQRAGLEQLKKDKDRDQGGPEVELIRIQVVEPELLANTRQASPSAGAVPTILISGRVRTAGGFKSLTVNGREEPVDGQGLFRARLPVRGASDAVVRIVAVDKSDRWATLELTAPRHTPAPAAPIGSLPEQIPRLKTSLGSYHALVIGNDRYAHIRPLKTAVSDARAVAAMLRDRYGFRVRLLENATRQQILAELDSLREKLTDKDNLLIYYAGHGEIDDRTGHGYWLAVDAQPATPATWLSNVDLSDLINAMSVRHLLVVADSCYGATLTRSASGRPELAPAGNDLAKTVEGLAARRSRMVMTSGGMEPVADSAGGVHSAFAQVFLDVLKGNDGTVLGRDLFGRLQLRVYEVAQRWSISQVPEYAPIKYAGHEGGDFFFVRPGS